MIQVELTETEIRHLLKLLGHGREYYRLLAGNAKCSGQNREMHLLTEQLCKKLESNLLVENR